MLTRTVLSIKRVSLQAAMSPSGPNSSQNKKESLKSKLSCVSFNSRSIVNKRLELSSLLTLKSYELVAITETFLDSTINSSEMFSDTFNVQRRDRSRHGGGVLLAVHQGLCCIREQISKLTVKFYGASLLLRNLCKSPGRDILQTSFERHRLLERVGKIFIAYRT